MDIKKRLQEYIEKLKQDNFHSINTKEIIKKLQEIIDNAKDI